MSDFEEPPYRCEWCETPHDYVSALFACETECARNRGRE